MSKRKNELVELIEMDADLLRITADRLDKIAITIDDSNCVEKISYAYQEILNLVPNLRMDLYLTRVVRIMERSK